MKTANREKIPFMIYTEKEGILQIYEARAVLDTSGTWRNRNPANSNVEDPEQQVKAICSIIAIKSELKQVLRNLYQ